MRRKPAHLWEKTVHLKLQTRPYKLFTKEDTHIVEEHTAGCSELIPIRKIRSNPTLKVRKGGGEEIPLVQGKEQWLRFAGAAVKRYPTPKVRETQVRW